MLKKKGGRETSGGPGWSKWPKKKKLLSKPEGGGGSKKTFIPAPKKARPTVRQKKEKAAVEIKSQVPPAVGEGNQYRKKKKKKDRKSPIGGRGGWGSGAKGFSGKPRVSKKKKGPESGFGDENGGFCAGRWKGGENREKKMASAHGEAKGNHWEKKQRPPKRRWNPIQAAVV